MKNKKTIEQTLIGITLHSFFLDKEPRKEVFFDLVWGGKQGLFLSFVIHMRIWDYDRL